jgi:hypothetical protein
VQTTIALSTFNNDMRRLLSLLLLPSKLAEILDKNRKIALDALKKYNPEKEYSADYSASSILSKEGDMLPEMFYTKMVDIFLIFIQDILKSIYASRSDLLNTDQVIKFSEVSSFNRYSDLTDYMIEKSVHEFSYSGIKKLNLQVKNRTGFELFRNVAISNRLSYIVECRNLIVHNRSEVNYRFKNNTRTKVKVGSDLKITNEVRVMQFLQALANDIDFRVKKKIKLKKSFLKKS